MDKYDNNFVKAVGHWKKTLDYTLGVITLHIYTIHLKICKRALQICMNTDKR